MVKIPFSPTICESKEWNKEENWVSFETTLDDLERSDLDGLSFVLTEDDPFVCIDLYKVKDNFEELQDIMSNFAETYKEISISGNEIHIFVKGRIHNNINNQTDRFKMYKSNKCIAMTGDVIGICTEIQNEQYKLNLYYEKYALKETLRELISYYKNIDSDVSDIEGILKTIYMTNRKDRELFKGEYSTGKQVKMIFNYFLF